MTDIRGIPPQWRQSVVSFSLLLLLFTVPHTLEDFASGEPAEAGIPAPFLALAVSILFSLQALGLYWLGQERRRGLFVHVGLGLFWPIASGLAQLPAMLSEVPYRSGAISITYVVGTIVVGILLCLSSIVSLRVDSKTGRSRT